MNQKAKELVAFLVPYYIVAQVANFGMKLTGALFIVSLLAPLPFSPLWGFMVIPFGVIFAHLTKNSIEIDIGEE